MVADIGDQQAEGGSGDPPTCGHHVRRTQRRVQHTDQQANPDEWARDAGRHLHGLGDGEFETRMTSVRGDEFVAPGRYGHIQGLTQVDRITPGQLRFPAAR